MTEKTQYTESMKAAQAKGRLEGLLIGGFITLVAVSAGFYLSNILG